MSRALTSWVSGRVLEHLPGLHDQKSHGRWAATRRAAKAAEEMAELRAALDRRLRAVSTPTSTPSRMTKAQYTRLLKDEHIRLSMLGGMSERDAKAAARPAATIDDLKDRNNALRRKLRASGVDYRTDEQRRTDDVEKNALLDEVQRLATAGGHDGAGKRAAASKLTVPELRKLVADTKAYQQRQADKARAARQGAAQQEAFRRRQAALPATDRQVDFIVNLLAARRRSGEEGGFFVGPVDRAGIARLSRADASAYIDSLKGDY